MLRMAPVAGTMMLFEAKEDTLGNLGTGEQEWTGPRSFPSSDQGLVFTPHPCISQDGSRRPEGHSGV